MIDEKDFFRSFVRHLPGVAFIKDGRGRYLFINDRAEAVLGR